MPKVILIRLSLHRRWIMPKCRLHNQDSNLDFDGQWNFHVYIALVTLKLIILLVIFYYIEIENWKGQDASATCSCLPIKAIEIFKQIQKPFMMMIKLFSHILLLIQLKLQDIKGSILLIITLHFDFISFTIQSRDSFFFSISRQWQVIKITFFANLPWEKKLILKKI